MQETEVESVGTKRPAEEAPSPDPHHQHILDHLHHQKVHRVHENFASNKDRYVKSVNTEDYVNTVGQLMVPDAKLSQYGYTAQTGRYPFDRVNALGVLLCPLRKVNVIEKWSPHDVAVFEAAITLFGKNFFRISKYVKTKNTKEVIEFYYDWKKTQHYEEWKNSYVPDDREIPSLIESK